MTGSVMWVPTEHIHAVWESVEGFLERSVQESHGDVDLMEIKTHLLNGTWSLLIAMDDLKVIGAVVFQFYNRINDRVAFIIAFSGRWVTKPELFDQLKLKVKETGATSIEGDTRPSAAKLFRKLGFTTKSVKTHYEL